MDEMMFCYQCEQAANCTACTGKAGVCGKSAETADAQDKLTGALIGFATLLLDIGRPIQPPQALLLTEGLFTTITNVDFDPQTVAQLTDKVWKAKQEAFASASPAPAPVSDYDMQKLWQEPDPDRKSLCSFVLFGLRGMAAYSYHARVLGYTDGEIDLFFCTALRAIAQERDKDKLFQLVEDTGRMAYRVMAELDKANTGAFGDPEPVEVPLTIEKGPFIVISGHDLYDAKCLLEQTEGKGINVYTHSEMLPAHGYPELKKRFPHLKGNFGTAWQNQQREFEDIPAPVLFTTNCIMPLRPSYADRVFTTSVVSYPGVTHIGEDRDFSPVIAKALELGGYPEDTLIPGMNGGSVVTTGFAHHAVLSHAEEIVQAVHEGAIRHFFLIGGCDGAPPPPPPLQPGHRLWQVYGPSGRQGAGHGRPALVRRGGPLARLGTSGGHRAGVRRHCPAAHRRGAGAGNRRRLVGQGQDGLHHGVHLPDAAHCPACAGSGVHGGDPGHHCPLGRGVFSEEQRCGGVE